MGPQQHAKLSHLLRRCWAAAALFLLAAPCVQCARVHRTILAASSSPRDERAWQNTLKWFPQVQQCPTGWMQQYSRLHADVAAGRLPARQAKWLVSVSAEAGVADRLSGLITLFWTAVMSQRAFSEHAYSPVPPFDAACDSPWINWRHPDGDLPAAVVDPLKYTYKGQRGFGGDRSYNSTAVNTARFQPLFLTTHVRREERGIVQPRHFDLFVTANLSGSLPVSGRGPDTQYIIAGANRGRTYRMAASNPYHRQQFWRLGLTPDNAFMCGFFFLCSPNAAVQALYQHFWQQLAEPGTLSIGIQVRVGDHVMARGDGNPNATLARAAAFFNCAQQIEAAHATPRQKVLWYLNSDSLQLRSAAKQRFGAKLLTDTTTKAVHPDCRYNDPATCSPQAMALAMQHSLGAMLTFSMTGFQVITHRSGFGRLPAWLSGRWDSLHDLEASGGCRVTPRAQSASHQAGVRRRQQRL